MVTAAHLQPATGARWLNYLAVSLLLNALLLIFITMPAVPVTVNMPDKLAITLKAVAPPLPATPPVVQQIATQQPAQPVTPPVVTTNQARKKIAKPVNKPTVKSAPAPVQRTVAEKPEIIEPKPLINEQPAIEKAVARNESKPVTAPVAPAPERQPVEQLTKQTESTTDDGGVDNASVVQEARYRKQVPPVYPRRALELGQQGTVTLHARVKPDGLAQELKVVATSGHSLLDKAALAAVEKWVFEPVVHNGIATTGWVRVPIEFVIQ